MVSVFVEVWTAVVSFVVGLFGDITTVFYEPGVSGAPGSLTFVGTMAVIMAGIALLLLVFNLIRSFFPARG